MKPDQILASLSQLAHQKKPVTFAAILFFSLVCLSLGGMQGWSVWQARAVQLSAATDAATSSARLLAGHVTGSLSLVDLVLDDVADRVQPDTGTPGLAALPDYLGERVRRTPLLTAVSVYDAGGQRTVWSGEAADNPVAVRDQLAHHRALAGPALHIGQPVRGVGGEWLLPVSRRLNGPAGEYAGMAMANVKLARLHSLAAGLPLGRGGAIMLAHRDGTLLLSQREQDNRIGSDVRNTEAFKATAGNAPARALLVPGGTSTLSDTLHSYQRLGPYPLVAVVSRGTDDILADWWDSAYLSTAGISLLLLVQLWVGIRLYGQIALRDRLEEERRSLQKLLVKKSRSLRSQALKDALTGIANRRQFDLRLASEFNRAINEGASIALVILDVDHFKLYNDNYGHPAGDECLKKVAACVNGGRRRSEDLAARMGGEEFALLLPNTGLRGAIAVAEAIRKTVAAHKLRHIPGNQHSVTVSCGVHALVPTEGMTPAGLIDAADRALYLAKTSGRNRVRAEGTMPPTGLKRFSLVVNK